MTEKTLKNVRKSFLNYFSHKDHKIVDSSNLVPNNDPTLMFTNSGMVKFNYVCTGVNRRVHTIATPPHSGLKAVILHHHV